MNTPKRYRLVYPKRQKYPKRAMPFRVPVTLSPAAAKQVGITPRIQQYADGFKAGGLSGLQLAQAIVEDIAGFQDLPAKTRVAQRLWARRSADEIMRTRKTIMARYEKEDLGRHRNVIQGCTDSAVATVAALRAAGFKALIAREQLHTYVKILCRHKGKLRVYKVNPGELGEKMITEMTVGDMRDEEHYGEKGLFAQGASLADIGITSYADFFKYSPRAFQRK